MRFRPKSARHVFGVLIASALIASACGADAEPTANVPPSDATVSEQSADLEAVMVPTASGGQLDFNSLRGQDVVLWFWAPW